MDCNYTYKGKSIQDIMELSKQFHKSVRQLSADAAIYSQEEVMNSTVNILKKAHSLRTQINAMNYKSVSDFITSSDVSPILKSIGLEAERLAPEYIEENRIYEYVKAELKNDIGSFDPKMIPTVDSKHLENLIKKFPATDENLLKFHLAKIEDLIANEEKTKNFGTQLHELIAISLNNSEGINSKAYKDKLANIIASDETIFGRNLEDLWTEKINRIVSDITNLALNRGIPITELTLVSGPNDLAKVKGRLDLIVVDKEGIAHIYDIKISKNAYDDWDNVKLLTLDWQLALYRQLLSKHIDVAGTELHVIPIQLSKLGDPNTLTYTGAKDRKNHGKSGLVEGGRLTTYARLLIPNEITTKYDTNRIDRFLTDLEGVIPNYAIKTSREDYDVDKIIKNAKKRGEWKFFNKFYEDPEFPVKYITAETEEEFREKITQYVEYAKTKQNLVVIKLRDAIKATIDDPAKVVIELSNKKLESYANKIFKDYLGGDWSVVNMPEAIALGFIVMKNNKTNVIDVISISAYNSLAEASGLDDILYGKLEYLKAFLFLNEYKSEFFIGKGSKIGNIVVFNPENGSKYFDELSTAFQLFLDRMAETGRTDKVALNTTHLLNAEQYAWNAVKSSLSSYEGKRKNELEEIFANLVTTDFNDIDLQKLIAAQKSMTKTFDLYDRNTNPTLNFSDPVEYLFALLQTAILKKKGILLSGDFLGMTNFALQFGDFKSLIAALYSKDNPEYDKEERKILGIMGGLSQVTPDFVRSNDLRNINLIIANVNSKIGQKMVEQSEKIHLLTEKYWNSIGYTGLQRSFVGETQSKFEHMFIQENNQVSSEFRVKNPYIINGENALTDNERSYLKGILFEIQKYMLNLNSEEITQIDPNSLESLQKNDKIAKAIKNGDYFKIPLVRREELSRHKELVSKGLHGFWERFKDRLHEVNDFLDPRELNPEDLKYLKDSALGFTEMYDIYGLQSDEYKAKVLQKTGVNYFEFNLDTIAHRVAFNKIRKIQFDAKLPIINAYIWWLKLHGGKQNKELDKVMDYLQNQLKLAAFDEPIIDDEFKTVATVTAVVKKVTTAAMLAFRPILLVKELTIGVMKGAGLAATQIYGKDQFTIKDLTSAYTKLMTIDNQFSNEFNLIDKLNHYYRFANMDVNTIAKKMQTDRRGAMKGVGRWMYSMNTIPDYFNRLSLFLAKMIHDGAYEAHSLEDGVFKYDVTKDKRFEYYLKNRDKHKNSKGEYVPAKNDELYNKQRNLYILLYTQLNQELGADEKEYTENDLVKKAYSEKERNSFKSFTDMAYGYYDKDSQSQLNNTWYGMIWLQFMQFWPGKMRQWVGKPMKGVDSPIGQFKQKTRTENGIEKLLWRKPVYKEDDDEVIDYFDEVTENTGDPLMEWVGEPQEGFIYSILYTIQDLFLGIKSRDFSQLKNNEQRLRRVAYAFHDAVLMFLVMGIFKAILDGLIAEHGTEGLSGELLQFGSAVDKKILNETNIFQNTLGAVQLTPISLSYGQRLAQDMGSVLNGNKTVMDLIGRNVGAFEYLKEI